MHALTEQWDVCTVSNIETDRRNKGMEDMKTERLELRLENRKLYTLITK